MIYLVHISICPLAHNEVRTQNAYTGCIFKFSLWAARVEEKYGRRKRGSGFIYTVGRREGDSV
jgi:hypothetical protein